MTIPGDLNTTAMAVMPHKDADRALEFALSMDIPFVCSGRRTFPRYSSGYGKTNPSFFHG